MKENFSDNYMIKRLEYINNKSLKHLNKIENNLMISLIKQLCLKDHKLI